MLLLLGWAVVQATVWPPDGGQTVLYMEHPEYRILCTSLIIPKLFFRFVDDIIIVWDEANGPYTDFLASLNSFHLDITLTDELEENRTLAFLDLLIKRQLVSDKQEILQKLELSVFRKITHCDRYIPFQSAHQMDLKRNLFRSLLLRAFWLLQNFPRQLEEEVQHLKNAFADPNNGYPLHTLEKWTADFRRQV